MRVTLTSKLVGSRVSEGSAFTAIASYFDDASDTWATTTPTTVKYRIDRTYGSPSCWSTVLDWTSLTPATSNSIAITAQQNAVTDQWAPYEKRQITVKLNDGLATQVEQTYLYRVTNLAGTT